MGKLVLTSGGYLDGQRGRECDEIIEELVKGKKVLLVDNATLTGSNVAGLPILIENFKQIANSISQLSLNEHNLDLINEYDVLYITGGDLLPFLQLIQNCNLAKVFVSYFKSGGCIIGESVGSMIFGKDLKWVYDIKRGTKPKYDIELQSYKGLGLVDINFFPHWNKVGNDIKKKVTDYEKQHNIIITRVEDNQFLEFSF